MKHFFALVGSLLLMVLLCATPPQAGDVLVASERPVVNLPQSLRQINWLGRQGQGSCAWASLIMDLNWSCEFAEAQRIRSFYGDGVTVSSLCSALDREQVPYVCTARKNNVELLEQAVSGRRAVLVGVNWEHQTQEANKLVLLTHINQSWV